MQRFWMTLFGWSLTTVALAAGPEPAGEPIFNGRDLTGWWTPGNLKSWSVEEGRLICTNQGGNYLRTEREYGDFQLSLEYKIARGGNSGIGIRTPRAGWPSGDGMELQIMDEPADRPLSRHSTMAIYGHLEPIARADRSEEWNQVVIRAEGARINAWVNGTLVQKTDTSWLPELKHRHRRGWIGFQDHGNRVEFRNIRLLELDPPATIPAPNAPSGSKVVAERLMNPQVLAGPDEAQTFVEFRQLTGGAEQEVARLTGPGALVELMRSGETGRLAFYIDDRPTPVIDVSANQLMQAWPALAPDRRPLLTYLPFSKSLRIVARQALATHYRLEYLRFAPGVSIEPFAGPEGTLARGMLPPLSYRYQQMGWGKHRDHEPTPRAASPKMVLGPGETTTLLELPDAGIVRWLKVSNLGGAENARRLWLEVTVDGESRPAISTPVRYLFPGIVAGKRYENFVVTDAGGWTTFLAMPFARGWKLTARNDGSAPIRDIVASVSYEPIDLTVANSSVPPWRLRGTFEPAGGSELLALDGPGRLVGIVVERPETWPRPTSLSFDYQPLDGAILGSIPHLLGISDEAGEQTQRLSGQRDGLAWRWLLPTPWTFDKQLSMRIDGSSPARLILSYRAR